jgi:purine-binding chemotaxis protein CheW
VSRLHVRVEIGGEHYAVPVDDVLEVAPLGELTPVPGAPPAVAGVLNLRGEVLAVVDLAVLVGVEPAGPHQRIVVAQGSSCRAGLAVESVVGVGDVAEAMAPARSPSLAGAALVDGELVGVVDVEAALRAVVEASAR